MKIDGTFTTPATADQLRSLFGSPDGLEQVPTLRDVTRVSPQVLAMVFTPRLTMGPVPLATTVTTLSDAADRVELAVVGARGAQSVDVRLAVSLRRSDGGTTVAWTGELVVRGGVASVGQRVVGDLASRAIGGVLGDCAAVAAADGERAA